LTVNLRNEQGDVLVKRQVSTEWPRVRSFLDEVREMGFGTESRVDEPIRAARADGEALGRLFERYRPFLKLMAQREIGPKLAVRADASDAVQQTFAEAQQAFRNFAGSTEPEFSAWIQRIHYHNLGDLVQKHVLTEKQSLRQEQRLDGPDATASFCWMEPAAKQSRPIQGMIKGERALRLAELIESLSLR
jgi:DNA-directed RNA polymerase specialized sigma24 family protein